MGRDILVAMRESGIRKTVAALLSASGHRVKEAEDVEHALPLLAEGPVHACVCDVRLPGSQGALTVARLLSAQPSMAVLVAYHPSEQEDAVESLKLGASDLLLQPVHSDELNWRVARLLEKGAEQGGRVEELQRLLAEGSTELQRVNAARAQLEGTLMRLAVADPLTGLFNRRVFEEKVAQEQSRAKRFTRALSVVAIDVDRADRIERTFGSDGLRDVIRQMGQYLREGLRETDICARVDDDEFALLLVETPLSGAREVALSLRRVLGSASYGPVGRVTVSVGVAALEGDDSSSLWQRAREQMARAKEAGRDRVEG